MFYFLHELGTDGSVWSLFERVTFRAGGAFLTAFLLVVLLTPWVLPFFRKHCVSKSSRTGGAKNSTPMLGGAIIVGAILLATVLWGRITEPMLYVFLLVTLVLTLLGMADDLIKVHYLREERDGVQEKTKLIVQFIVAMVAVYALYKTHGTATMQIYVPFSRQPFQFLPSPATIEVWLPFMSDPAWIISSRYMPWCLLLMLGFNAVVVSGTSNGVNLTDGKDGLAPGCVVVAALTFAVIAYVTGHKYFALHLDLPYVPEAGEVGIYACAMAGGCLGFLWHNCYPASIIMGDTGSLPLGGSLALIAIMLGQQLLVPIIGFVFMIEALSSLLQRLSMKYRHGKKLFLMAPIHHHFVKLGWDNQVVVVRFWLVAILAALCGLATLKLR